MNKVKKCLRNLMILIATVIVATGALLHTGCNKQQDVAYQPISFEYDETLLGNTIELPEAGISYQPIAGWDALSEDQFNQIRNEIMMNTPLILLSAQKPLGHDYISLFTQFPFMENQADTLLSFQYLESQIAQSDTLFSRGKFAHNGIHFDQIITRSGELTAIHMVGNPLGTKNRFGISYLITNNDYTDNIKRMEASIASIKPLRR